jgi:hypothetical protein
MKKLILLAFCLVFLKSNLFCQFTFGISTGLTFNSGYFGYKVNDKLITYAGFQYANIGVTTESTGKEYNYSINQLADYSHKYITSENLYLPNIGAKYFINNINKIKSYLTLNISKPILGGKVTNDGKESDSFNKSIENLSMWGGEFGFGTEYFFDDNFSLGGEFGIRYFHYSNKSDYNNTIYDPSIGRQTNSTSTDKYSLSLSPTYSKISLNYYFK